MGPTERALMIASQAGNGDALVMNAGAIYALAGGAVLAILIGFGILYVFGNVIIDHINRRRLIKTFEEEEKNEDKTDKIQ